MSSHPAPIGELFASSWEEYKNRGLPILALILISTGVIGSLAVILVLLAGVGGALVVHGQIYRGWMILLTTLGSILFLITVVLGLWFHTAMLALVVDKSLGLMTALRKGWQYLWSMTWVIGIFSAIVLTGILFGILPAILTLVWFSFSVYILLEEERRGMDALLASREYVRGNWWNTFGKLLVIWLLYTLIAIIPFVGTLASIFFYPFLMIFMAAVYHDLKSSKGEVELRVSPGTRLFWWVVTVIGLILPIIGLLGALVTLLNGSGLWMQETGSQFHGLES